MKHSVWKAWLLPIFVGGVILVMGLANYGFTGTTIDAANAYSLIAHSSNDAPVQVKNIQQVTDIKDVSPDDYYFASLQNLIERYRVDVTLPDGTFQGDAPLKRGDFVVYLDETLTQLNEVILAGLQMEEGDVSYMGNENNDRLEQVIEYINELNGLIGQLQTRLETLEQAADL